MKGIFSLIDSLKLIIKLQKINYRKIDVIDEIDY